MPAKIRLIQVGDLDVIIEIFIRTYSKEPWNEEWDYATLKERIMDFILNNTGLNYCAIDKEGKILGVMFGRRNYWIKSKEYFIDEFFIDYKLQNKGIGHFMINEVSKIIQKNGYSCMILNTEKGFPCEKFYLKNGFVQKESNIFIYKVL